MIKRYGHLFPEHYTDLEIECVCFREGFTVEDGALGKAGHFRKIVEILWPENGFRPFLWTPWAEDMLRVSCEHQYLCVSGAGSSGKSVFYAVWALVNWMIDPLNTLVLVTSTTLKGAKKRIWGAIEDYFNAVKDRLPGKLVASMGMIRTYDKASNVLGSDRSGLHIITGEKGREKETLGKLIGMRNKRVMLIGDELPELSHTLVKAVLGNLSSNPWFQFVGIGNPNSIYDPHGRLATPKDGWGTVDATMKEWPTKLGWHIRFDAEESPNIIAGKVIWDFLPTQEKLDRAIEDNPEGKDSLEYWRMYKAFWCPEGSSKGLYTEPMILNTGSQKKEVAWAGAITPIAFIDLGYTNGGDQSIATFGHFGRAEDGYDVLLFVKARRITEEKKDPQHRMTQIAKKYIALCKEHGVQPRHAGYDATGAGTTFGALLAEFWDSGCHHCDFSGRASDRIVSLSGKKAYELFTNKSTEIWAVGTKFLECGQLRGITGELAREMTSRNVTLIKGADGARQAIEEKKLLRNRTGTSPDLADSYFGLLDVCRDRLGFIAFATQTNNRWQAAQWKKFREKAEEPERGAVPMNVAGALESDNPFEVTPRRQINPFHQPVQEEGWGSMSMFN